MKMIPFQEYHTPDVRWGMFGKPDFETYSKDYVVKGLFHADVPKDVIDAYEVAEYMQAHAYYHYPLYDEGVSKILRIMEMAVKFRCKQLEIALEAKKLHRKTKQPEAKPLGTLMTELAKMEPNKKLDWQFGISKDLRNSYMHPDRHSYMGGMAYSFIQRTVTLLNKVFLPNEFFIQFDQQLEEIRNNMKLFKDDVFVLSFKEKRFLVENARVEEALLVNEEWIYCLTCSPILKNAASDLANHSVSDIHYFFIKNLIIKEGTITANQLDSDEIIHISHTNHPQNIEAYRLFLLDKNNALDMDRVIYENCCESNIAKHVNEFWYFWLYKVKGKENDLPLVIDSSSFE